MKVTRVFAFLGGALLSGSAFTASGADAFSVTPPDVPIVRTGGTVQFKTKATKPGAPAPKVDWTAVPVIPAATSSEPKDQEAFSYTAPATGSQAVEHCIQIGVTGTAATGEAHTVYVTLVPAGQLEVQELCPGASIVISVLGVEQAGATSADSSQKFFFDFFQSYALPVGKAAWGPKARIYGPPWRWWGDLRIASYPQQISTPVSQFAGQFAQQLGNVPVNQLAQFGEFRSGLERRIAGFERHFLPNPGAVYERTSLGAFFYFGGQGSLSNPVKIAQVFDIPAPGTPQRAAFDRAFPVSRYPDLALPATTHVGLTPPDRERAFWQYGAGFRLTTRFFDPDRSLIPAPAMVSASFGQNELVTGGKRRGIVGTFEGFYPLPLGIRTKEVATIYLFGRANLKFGRAALLETPLALAPAINGSGSQATPVPITDPSVAVIAFASNRDLYAIGVGGDAVQIIKSIMSIGKTGAKPTDAQSK